MPAMGGPTVIGREKRARRQPGWKIEVKFGQKMKKQKTERTPMAWPAPRGPHKSNAIGPEKDPLTIHEKKDFCGGDGYLGKKKLAENLA